MKTRATRVAVDLAAMITENATAEGLEVAAYLDPILRGPVVADHQRLRETIERQRTRRNSLKVADSEEQED